MLRSRYAARRSATLLILLTTTHTTHDSLPLTRCGGSDPNPHPNPHPNQVWRLGALLHELRALPLVITPSVPYHAPPGPSRRAPPPAAPPPSAEVLCAAFASLDTRGDGATALGLGLGSGLGVA